jgi:hypothetical protein
MPSPSPSNQYAIKEAEEKANAKDTRRYFWTVGIIVVLWASRFGILHRLREFAAKSSGAGFSACRSSSSG